MAAPAGAVPWYPPDLRLGGPYSGGWEQRNLCPCRESNSGSVVIALTALFYVFKGNKTHVTSTINIHFYFSDERL